MVSTHSHPKVAANASVEQRQRNGVSTHSHPKVAAPFLIGREFNHGVSTHSHPKVAAMLEMVISLATACFNTQPPEGGCKISQAQIASLTVSTHSHPKVAA